MNSQRRLGEPARDPLEVLTRPARRPDLVLRYGDGAEQVADVHLPRGLLPEPGAEPAGSAWSGVGAAGTRGGAAGSGRRVPLAIFFHGGFWRAEYDREHTGPLAEALAEAGFAVCAPEYTRTGAAGAESTGAGWPGTFDDVAAAVDRLPVAIREATGGSVDLSRMLLAGHSAGGHLALWAASRHRLPEGSPWRAAEPSWCGVVALAAVSDLTACYRWRLGQQAAGALMGGGSERYPERYAEADPVRLVPPGVPVRLMHGTSDDRVPWQMSLGYSVAARTAGATGPVAPVCVVLPGTGHFEVIDPLSAEWPQVVAAFRQVAGCPLADGG